MSSIGYGVFIDRDGGFFDIQVDYFIDPYFDPETFEVFSDTSWVAAVGSGGTGGFGGESESAVINLGFGVGETLENVNFHFTAQNTFSGLSVALTLNIMTAAYATGDLVAVGTAARSPA